MPVEKADRKMHPSYQCKECKMWVPPAPVYIYNPNTQKYDKDNAMRGKMMAAGMCFADLFWMEKYELGKTNPNVVRANGEHYIIGSEAPSPAFARGHGGAKWTIVFDTGRIVTTTNLWSQGTIPAHWRGRMPDNAVLREGE